jgi:hypothetical protein
MSNTTSNINGSTTSESGGSKIWIIIGVITLVIVVIIAIVWILDAMENKNNTTTFAKVNEACVTNTSDSTTVPICGTGLACIKTAGSNVGVCKSIIGNSCVSTNDCVAEGFCVNNICSTSEGGGGLNQPAPCNSITLVDVGGICKAVSGASCSQTSDCATFGQQCVVTNINNPSVKTCTNPKALGQPCVYNDDCTSLYCDPTSKVCSVNGGTDGNYGASCIYYAANNEYNNCVDIYKCQRDLANAYNTTTSVGICLPPVTSWPYNDPNQRICSSSSNSCIPPSVCYNGICIFPPDDKLSCAVSASVVGSGYSSSGGCLKGFVCDNSTRCVPTSGYPGNGTVWKIVQWIRSINGQMGQWVPLQTLPLPGLRPSFTSYTPNGTNSSTDIFIYTTDVSTNTYAVSQNSIKGFYKPYYLVYNGNVTELTLNFINSDNQSHTYVDVPYDIKFIPSNSGMKIAILVRQYLFTNINPPNFKYRSWWVMLATLDVTNPAIPILNIYRPSYNIYINNANLDTLPTNFDLDLRNGRFLYNLTDNSNYYLRECPINATTDNLAINNTGTSIQALDISINPPVNDLQFVTYTPLAINSLISLGINTGDNIVLYNTGGVSYGETTVNKMNITTYPSSISENLEILYTQTFNSITSLYLVKGENSVIMPVDVNINTIPNISILDSTVTNQLPNLYILTPTVS